MAEDAEAAKGCVDVVQAAQKGLTGAVRHFVREEPTAVSTTNKHGREASKALGDGARRNGAGLGGAERPPGSRGAAVEGEGGRERQGSDASGT